MLCQEEQASLSPSARGGGGRVAERPAVALKDAPGPAPTGPCLPGPPWVQWKAGLGRGCARWLV